MKHMKRTLSILLTLVLLCTGVPFAFAEDVTIVDSGYCGAEGDGANLTWTLDSEGKLTISGTGDMTSSPWKSAHSSQIKSVVIEDGVKSIGERAFERLGSLKSVLISDSVISIGISSFEYCESLQRVILSHNLKTIKASAFFGCLSLTSIVLPDSLISIEESAFSDCRSLETIVIPDGVTTIEDSTFEGCIYLNVTIGKNVSSIKDRALFNTKRIIVNDDNECFSTLDGVLFNKDQTLLLVYPASIEQKTYSVPDGVIEIADWAFLGAAFLESVILPASIERIGSFAFAGEIGVPCDYTIKSLNIDFSSGEYGDSVFVSQCQFLGISDEEARRIVVNYYFRRGSQEEVSYYRESFLVFPNYENEEEFFYVGTLRCHAGSTAEAYAIEHNMNYELTHFFEGDWTYDWDNLVRWRKCIHCDERETEPLETETPGGAEIVGPADGDTSFDVEPVSTDYVLIKETLGEMNVIKAFDISLKNQDGVHVQPSGTVKVKLPGDIKAGDYKVYRVNADGTYTDMNAFLQGSHLVFYTDHFSLYVVVDESAPTEPDTPNTPDTPAKESKISNLLHTIFEFLQKLIRLIFVK